MIDILLPTYNRAVDLKKNIQLLINQIEKHQLIEVVKISVSDNCSIDNTIETVNNFISSSNIQINVYQQEENIGLEKNALFLLQKSTDDFVMYLGDDDYIPDDYLLYLVNKINSINNLTCIIPGFSSLYLNGKIKPARYANFEEKIMDPSFKTVISLSQFGHQLSGLCLKRKGLYENYISDKKLRNIYLFIFFVSYNILRGVTIYAPKFQVLVSQGNSKDWNYDDSGLLTEIFKNYKLVFKGSYIKRNIMNFVFMNQQRWRIRVGKNLLETYKSFIHIEKNEHVDLLTKVFLPFQYIYLYARTILSKIKRVIFK